MGEKGHIIFLNGASSAGKTTIAQQLVHLLGSYSHVSLDDFLHSSYKLDELETMQNDTTERSLDSAVSEFHHYIAKMSSGGRNLVVDHVLRKASWSQECGELLSAYPVILVYAYCPLEVLVEREQSRNDRLVGTAAFQFDSVNRNKAHDIVVDTSLHSPVACAQQIIGYLNTTTFSAIDAEHTKRKFFSR